MFNKQNIDLSKTNLLKITIVALICIVIGGIWFVKNNEINEDIVEKGSKAEIKNEEITAKGDQSAIETKGNTDFELHETDELDLEKLKSYGLPIVLDFGADSCIPCKEMAPVLKELNAELQGKAIIKFVDVWKYQKLADGYPIRVIPTQVFFDKDGKPYTPSDPEKMQMLMYGSRETNEHIFTTHEGGMTKEQILDVLKEMGVE